MSGSMRPTQPAAKDRGGDPGAGLRDVPYIPLGAFYPSTVYRSNLTGVLDGQALFWNVRRD